MLVSASDSNTRFSSLTKSCITLCVEATGDCSSMKIFVFLFSVFISKTIENAGTLQNIISAYG